MSSEVVISIENLSKCYRIYEKPQDRLKQSIYSKISRTFGKAIKIYYREFWALKNISFEVKKGEAVGIIGSNGSGKSTLLQLICGISNPTNGTIKVKGRVAALLELGSGFNPDFTGRENIYMNAALLGLSRAEVDERYERILQFADIGEFIDQPIKTYSSGMVVRLAFAVVVNVDPDILIVDEALAVGDMLFQSKCMLRLREMIDHGVTMLFVSHDTAALRALCDKALYLSNGINLGFQKAPEIIDKYMIASHEAINKMLLSGEILNLSLPIFESQSLSKKEIFVSTEYECKWPHETNRYGNAEARVLDVKLLNSKNKPTNELDVGEEFVVQVSIKFNKEFSSYVLGYSMRDLKGQMLVGAITSTENFQPPKVAAGDIYVVNIAGKNQLAAGIYSISVGLELPVILNKKHVFMDVVENVVIFKSNFDSNPINTFPFMVRTSADFIFTKI